MTEPALLSTLYYPIDQFSVWSLTIFGGFFDVLFLTIPLMRSDLRKLPTQCLQVISLDVFLAVSASSADIAVDLDRSEQSCRDYIAGTVGMTDDCLHTIDFTASAFRADFCVFHVLDLRFFVNTTVYRNNPTSPEKQCRKEENFL